MYTTLLTSEWICWIVGFVLIVTSGEKNKEAKIKIGSWLIGIGFILTILNAFLFN